MRQYLDYLQHILDHGVRKDDRTGTGTISTFGYQMRFDLAEGFPLLTTKKLHLRSISTSCSVLEWGYEHPLPERARRDDLGRVGRRGRGPRPGVREAVAPLEGDNGSIHDQIDTVLQGLRENPDSRRHIVSAWKVDELSQMALPPCHALFQFYVAQGRLSCQLYQRSVDSFLGLPSISRPMRS